MGTIFQYADFIQDSFWHYVSHCNLKNGYGTKVSIFIVFVTGPEKTGLIYM